MPNENNVWNRMANATATQRMDPLPEDNARAYDERSIKVLHGLTRCASGRACISAIPMTAPACII